MKFATKPLLAALEIAGPILLFLNRAPSRDTAAINFHQVVISQSR